VDECAMRFLRPVQKLLRPLQRVGIRLVKTSS
jgi:hypothetical protein